MKRRILSDQKRKALRRVLIAAAALVLINHFLMIGLLFPFQALRRCEERAGTGRTSVVCRERAKEIGWSCLIYLTGNENATMLSNISLGPLGWGEGEGLVLDCSGEAPLHGGWWSALFSMSSAGWTMRTLPGWRSGSSTRTGTPGGNAAQPSPG